MKIKTDNLSSLSGKNNSIIRRFLVPLIKCHRGINQWNKAYKYCIMRYDPVEDRYESKESRSQTSYFLIITACLPIIPLDRDCYLSRYIEKQLLFLSISRQVIKYP